MSANGRLELDHLHPEYSNLSDGEHKAKAYSKLQEWIANGTKRAESIVTRIMNEVPVDRVVPAAQVEYIPASTPSGVDVQLGRDVEHVGRHALQQIATKSGLPFSYIDTLKETDSDWGRELLAHNLNELHRHMPGRVLTRSVNGELRGWLSDRYRRLDSRPIVDATIGEVQKLGGQIVDGLANETKISLRVIVPRVIEVVKNDYAVLGFSYTNSDFGDGALSFTAFLMRLICLNGAMRESALRQVHLGAKLADSIAFSERTYQLDSDATASASADLVKALLSPEKATEMVEAIRTANDQKIDPKAALAALRSKNSLSKGEAASVADTFNTPDIEVLPPGQNRWRFSNAISFLAKNTEDVSRRMELERLAGEVMTA